MTDVTHAQKAHSRAFYRRPLEWSLIGLSAVLVIWTAKTLGVLPERLNVLGAEAEFNQEDKDVLFQNDEKLASLRAELNKLRDDVAKLVVQNQNGSAVSAAEILEVPANQGPISDRFLQNDLVQNGAGVMWIGEWDPVRGAWVDGSVAAVSGNLPPPWKLNGNDVQLTTKVNIRESLPSRDESYYQFVPVKGIADEGAVATVQRIAEPYQRATGVQYWAEVAVDYQPKRSDALNATRSLKLSSD